MNKKNVSRVALLDQLQNDFSLKRVPIPHNTYHHFVGEGKFDSDIDVLLHSDATNINEEVVEIICKSENPLVLSHHDVILSCVHLPARPESDPDEDLVTAPRLPNTREKIVWSAEGAEKYKLLVAPQLREVRESFLDSGSTACMSVLLKVTNHVLASCASLSNKAISLGKKYKKKSLPTPRAISTAKHKLSKAHRHLKSSKMNSAAKQAFTEAQKKYKNAIRSNRVRVGHQRDQKLFSILSENPSSLYSYVKSSRNSDSTSIQKLTVADKTYTGESVPDGFFESMTSIKTCDIGQLESDPVMAEHFSNHQHILKLCKDHHKIPAIPRDKASKLLSRMKKNVKDYYSITAQHYVNAGEEGLIHFNELLNAIVDNVNNASIEELNTAHGLILYKGHNKEKTSDRAYRTISSCPFIAKALDLYLRDLYHELWDKCQAPTQYQGTGSCHELASLLITEAIQHSLYVLNKPVYFLSVDALSAFDRCLRQILVSELHKAGVGGAAITIIDKRLEGRATVYDWNGTLMGPGQDITGFEQGGINSSDFYKLYNNEQLNTAQASGLGVDIGSSVVSAIGQADDVVLIANDIDSLALLVRLTESYCAKYRVTLVPSKTKLLAFHTENQKQLVHHAKAVSQVSIAGINIKFVEEAEHVGIIRNTAGNLPNITHRIAAHKKAMGSVLSAGLARGHRGNPAASLRVQQVYGTSVLFSGLASLVLSPAEVKIVDQHFQKTVQNLQKLYDKTPRSLIFLMAGSLPGEAILHMKQLTLFSMICHLPDNPINKHGRHTLLSAPDSAKSWFQQIHDLCLKYSLDHPHSMLTNPPAKSAFKNKVKKAVTEYWEDTLRGEASSLDSLSYFLPLNYNLQEPHPLWTTAGSNIFECHKSSVLAKMISGRFRTEYLARHWTSNRQGHCQLESCHGVVGDLEHLLIGCSGLETVRARMREMMLNKTKKLVPLNGFICQILLSSPKIQMQFFLEPLAFVEILRLCEVFGQTVLDLVFYCTRTYAYYMYRDKQIMLGLWPGDMVISTRNEKTIVELRKPKPDTSNVICVAGQQSPAPGACQELLKANATLSIQEQDKSIMSLVPPSTPGEGASSLPLATAVLGMCGLNDQFSDCPAEAGQLTTMDYTAGRVGCDGLVRATCGRSDSTKKICSDTMTHGASHNCAAENCLVSDTRAGVGRHGSMGLLSASHQISSSSVICQTLTSHGSMALACYPGEESVCVSA